MEHRDRIRQIFESNKFINVSTKLKNSKLSNDTAWIEAQPLLEFAIEGYPDKFRPFLDRIRQVFNVRRSGFFMLMVEKTRHAQSTSSIIEATEGLSDDELELLSDSLVFLRDFFERPRPSKIHRHK